MATGIDLLAKTNRMMRALPLQIRVHPDKTYQAFARVDNAQSTS